MDLDLELISASDKPALLALRSHEWLARVRAVLTKLGYKVHAASDHEDFMLRLGRVSYQIVFLEDLFDASSREENRTLRSYQRMPMNQRRNTVSFLIGEDWQTLHPLHAFQQSVHAVVNPADLDRLGLIVQQGVSDHEIFLRSYGDAERRIAQS